MNFPGKRGKAYVNTWNQQRVWHFCWGMNNLVAPIRFGRGKGWSNSESWGQADLWKTESSKEFRPNPIGKKESQKERLNSRVTWSGQGYGFSSSHIWMWELDCEESWAPKNWCFWTVVLEKTLESSLDCKEIKPVHPKGDQSWIFLGRTEVEADTPILWPPHVKSWLTGKDSDAGRDWGQEEKATTEDEMAGWYHRLDGCEFEWVGVHQGGLVCCNSWGQQRVRHDWATELNWTEHDQICFTGN